MKELICIVCPNGCRLQVDEENGLRVTGNACPRGEEYGRNELLHPVRVLTGTVRLHGGTLPRCPVKTRGTIPKEKLLEAARALCMVDVDAPVRRGDVVLADICGTGVDVVASRDVGLCPWTPPPFKKGGPKFYCVRTDRGGNNDGRRAACWSVGGSPAVMFFSASPAAFCSVRRTPFPSLYIGSRWSSPRS